MPKEPNKGIEPGTEQASDGEPTEIPDEALGAVTGGWPADGGVLNYTLN